MPSPICGLCALARMPDRCLVVPPQSRRALALPYEFQEDISESGLSLRFARVGGEGFSAILFDGSDIF